MHANPLAISQDEKGKKEQERSNWF
jgi:hypothetical protein